MLLRLICLCSHTRVGPLDTTLSHCLILGRKFGQSDQLTEHLRDEIEMQMKKSKKSGTRKGEKKGHEKPTW